MNVHFNHFQQSRNGRRREGVPAIAIACLIIVILSIPAKAQSSAPETVPQQQAAAFMRKEIANVVGKLLKDFPNDMQITMISVKYYQQCKNPRKAMALLEQGLKANPKSFDLNNTVATMAFNNGQYEKAIIFGKKTLAIKPNAPVVQENMAEAMIFSGKYTQAVEILDNRVAVFGESSHSYWMLGKGHMFLKNYEKAKDYFEKSYQKNPDAKIGYFSNMSKVYMRLKQPEKARKYMKMHSKITAEKKLQRLEDAKNKKERVVTDSSDPELLVFSKVMARLCIRGRKLYRDKQKPKDAEKLFDNAQDIFNKSSSIATDNADIYREFAYMYLITKKNLDKALTLAQKAVDIKKDAENYYILGHLYKQNSDLEKALIVLTKAVELKPNNLKYKRMYNRIKRGLVNDNANDHQK